MASLAQSLTQCDGYRVLTTAGLVGWVEEVWLDAREEPTAIVVHLVDGRRGLLVAGDIAGVSAESDSLTMAPDGSLLRLDPPHVETDAADGSLAASWRTAGVALELPQPAAARLRDRLRLPHPLRAGEQLPGGERPIWWNVAVLYGAIGAIVSALIVLDFLIAYVVTGATGY